MTLRDSGGSTLGPESSSRRVRLEPGPFSITGWLNVKIEPLPGCRSLAQLNLFGLAEDESDSANSVQELYRKGVVDFAPYARDVHVNHIIQRGVSYSDLPNVPGQHFSGNNCATVDEQIFEQLKFSPGKFEHRVATRDGVAPEIHLQISNLQHRRRVGIGTAMQSSDAGQQLRKSEGLEEVIVSAGIQASHAIVDRSLRSQDKNRHPVTVPPQFPQNLEPAQSRQHQVDENQIKWLSVEVLETGFAGVSGDHLIAISFQTLRDCGRELVFVFNEQDPHRNER